MRATKVVVVGAGVIGLTTALEANKAGYEVRMVADKPPWATTSSAAGASFKPHGVAYNALAHGLVATSWESFADIAARHSHVAGVRKHVHWDLSSAPYELPESLSIMEQLESVEGLEVPGDYRHGWRYLTFLIDVPEYLGWLWEQIQGHGIEVTWRKLGSLEELDDEPADVCLNCTGMGARELCGDPLMIPTKGQVVLFEPRPTMRYSVSADGFCIYPRRSNLVVGATHERGIDNEVVDPGAAALLVRGSQRVLPDLTLTDSVGRLAAVRPFREQGIRIEAEDRRSQRLIHNYGHGGSGYTLSWGSARMAVGLI